MRDFDSVLDRAGSERLVVLVAEPKTYVEPPLVVATPVAVLKESVVVTHIPVASSTHVLKVEAEWGWEELRDYVVNAITARHGAFPRNFKTEASIFKSFVSRYPADAPAIAKFAFENVNGMWANAPISVNRFCKGSDPYFSDKIVMRLRQP